MKMLTFSNPNCLFNNQTAIAPHNPTPDRLFPQYQTAIAPHNQ
ncbi:hypothetical protein [Pseudanabaena minima]